MQSLKNLDAVAREAGTTLHNAVKLTVFILSMENNSEVNRAYIDFFNIEVKPVSSSMKEVLLLFFELDQCDS